MTGGGEAETARDGLLSHSGEWHALVLGVGAGVVWAVAGRPEFALVVVALAFGRRRQLEGRGVGEVRREPWYAVGGVLAAVVVAWTVRGVL